LSDLPVETYRFDGRDVPIEPPVETVLKKLYHRAEFLKPRDIFDVAVVLTDNRPLLESKLFILSSVRENLERRLETLPRAYYEQALEELDIFPAWDHLKASALSSVISLVKLIP
jgi:hypothetical protein